MLKTRIGLLALAIFGANHAFADDQASSNGFVEDSHLNLLLRNAYINRDFHQGSNKSEWGQGVTADFKSGFTQGTVGVGVDAFALYALRLDGGKGRSGAGGIDMFKQGDSGSAADDLAKAGAAIKFRVSNTVFKFGDQMPALPVLSYDNSRLLPEYFTGGLLTSKEIDGLEVNVGRFTSESRKSAEGRDSGDMKSITVYGASYKFTDNFTGSLYASDNEDVFKKQYLGLNYVFPIASDQSLTLDFNGYRTKLDSQYADENGYDGRDNKIWSLAATYAYGPHSFTLAHQRSTGDTGYLYGGYQNDGGFGDGGNTIYLSNSYLSDFNGKDERSWQLAYGLDFSTFGVPGLTYKVAFVRGTDIDDGTGRGDGTEREWFNQFQYVVQSGPAKDLSVKLRSSFLRVSDNASNYFKDVNELRVYVDYPISVF